MKTPKKICTICGKPVDNKWMWLRYGDSFYHLRCCPKWLLTIVRRKGKK